MTIFVTGRTWVLTAVFAVLYAAIAYGLVAQDVSPLKVLVALAGAAAIAAIFYAGAVRQRASLRAFIERLSGEGTSGR